MGVNPSVYKGPNKPVGAVPIREAVAYCNKLSLNEGLEPAYSVTGTDIVWKRDSPGYRLPTDAEWEYFARAGTTENTYAGVSGRKDPDPIMNNIAWCRSNSRTNPSDTSTPECQIVGQKVANPWGLYDVLGNVSELCFESPRKYTDDSQVDPWNGWDPKTTVMRGGNFSNNAGDCVVTTRWITDQTPATAGSVVGFRVVRNR